MKRSRGPNTLGLSLVAVKAMILEMKDAMPSHAKNLRREACETLDDLIDEVRA